MEVNVPLPLNKLSVPQIEEVGSSDALNRNRRFVVLLSPGSFSPPTYMHLRIFELAKDALQAEGYFVIGCYMSPVNDAYGKKGLLSSRHRLQMCELACKSSSFIMVDPWEAKQSSFQRTLTVLSRVYNALSMSGLCAKESLKVMLLCGSDLLESLSIPGFWIRDQDDADDVQDDVEDQQQICEVIAHNKADEFANRSGAYVETSVLFVSAEKGGTLRKSYPVMKYCMKIRITSSQ